MPTRVGHRTRSETGPTLLVRVLLTHWHAAKPHYKDQQNLSNFSTTSVSPNRGPCEDDFMLRISKQNIHVMKNWNVRRFPK